MSQTHPSQIDQVCDRVERLLLRHEELRRTNHLLQEQIDALVHERDSLKSRLRAVRARVDSLIERLPACEAGGLLATTAPTSKATREAD